MYTLIFIPYLHKKDPQPRRDVCVIDLELEKVRCCRWKLKIWRNTPLKNQWRYTPQKLDTQCSFPYLKGHHCFKYLLFSLRSLGKIPILTHILQMGWNHQLETMEIYPLRHHPKIFPQKWTQSLCYWWHNFLNQGINEKIDKQSTMGTHGSFIFKGYFTHILRAQNLHGFPWVLGVEG